MASHSPQRQRKSQPHPATQGMSLRVHVLAFPFQAIRPAIDKGSTSLLRETALLPTPGLKSDVAFDSVASSTVNCIEAPTNLLLFTGTIHAAQARENSPSPSLRDRSRTIKAQSMPLVPSVAQIFAANAAAQQMQSQQQQSSPTIPSILRRSPPVGVQVQRLLPTPPHPSPPNIQDMSPERRASPPPQHSNSQPNVNYPRPMNRVSPPHFLTKFQNMEQSWQMTDELMADIERADLQQSQTLTHPYSAVYARGEVESPPKDHTVERVRITERSSPKDLDNSQHRRQREQQTARESPKNRDRQPTSPTAPSFIQAQSNTPERQISPPYLTPVSPGEQPASYTQYSRESPPVIRRASNADPRPQPSMASQTPPIQAVNARSDRSLPVQEEPEDELTVASKGSTVGREMWKTSEHTHSDNQHRQPSPTPSSDIHSEDNEVRYDANHTHGGRDSRAGHRGGDVSLVEQDGVEKQKSLDRERTDEDEGYTPRSPTAGLPENPRDNYYPQNPMPRPPVRGRTRNGPSDQLGLRGFDPAVFEQPEHVAVHNPRERSPQYAEQRKHVQQVPQPQPQSYQQQSQHYHDQRVSNSQSYQPQIHPDDIHSFGEDPASAYIQAYLQSPRPDAPIPPTPHSQTAAPSPSPLISEMYGGARDLPPFSPVAPVGSPYPYPFTHVRRNQSYSGQPSRPQVHSSYDQNHPSVIQEQLARQWQVYAQNNHGHITDSTFSPSTTPFQGAGQGYNPWAFLHTNRILGGRMHDAMSLQSSPSHEPVALPPPPPVGLKKKNRTNSLRTQVMTRKPPPRVESTQPRETSPEPSSSGEETAGEEHFAAPEGGWTNGIVDVTLADDGDWVDEEDEGDGEDLLDLEYHPSFVSNIEKRRRRWEIGWEALTQAVSQILRILSSIPLNDNIVPKPRPTD